MERPGKRDVARLRPVAHTPQGDSEVPTPAALNRPRATRRRRAGHIRSANASRASGVVRCPRKPAPGDDLREARARGQQAQRRLAFFQSSAVPESANRVTTVSSGVRVAARRRAVIQLAAAEPPMAVPVAARKSRMPRSTSG